MHKLKSVFTTEDAQDAEKKKEQKQQEHNFFSRKAAKYAKKY
jgi:hypothetical protein